MSTQTTRGPKRAQDGEASRNSIASVNSSVTSLNESIISGKFSTKSCRRARFTMSAEKIRSSTGRFIRRVSDTVGRALPSRNKRKTTPKLAQASMERGFVIGARTDGNGRKRGTPATREPEDAALFEQRRSRQTFSMPLIIPLRGRLRSNTRTSTSPDVCYWMTSPPFNVEYDWIRGASYFNSGHQDIHRIASCLRRAFTHLYDLPIRDYPMVAFPPTATGYKSHYRMDGQRLIYPRGAKGLKKVGDPEIPLQRYEPKGLQSNWADSTLFQAAGSFFPQPSKLSHVQYADDSMEMEDSSEKKAASERAIAFKDPTPQGTQAFAIQSPESNDVLQERKPRSSLSSLPAATGGNDGVVQDEEHLSAATHEKDASQEDIRLPPVTGEEPKNYYGLARDYSGSITSNSRSSVSDCEDTGSISEGSVVVSDMEPEPDFTGFDGNFPRQLDGSLTEDDAEEQYTSKRSIYNLSVELSEASLSRTGCSISPSPEDDTDALSDAPTANQWLPHQLPLNLEAAPEDTPSESGSMIHNNEEFGVFHGLDEPPIQLRPSSIDELSALMEATDDEVDHDEAEALEAPYSRPALPPGYMYKVPDDVVIHTEPHLIVFDAPRWCR